LRFTWPGDATEVRPRPEDRELALFELDANNRALTCPGSARPSSGGHLCVLEPTVSIRLDNSVLWTAASFRSHEWDGMYGFDEDVVIAIPTPHGPRPIHTLTQWNQDVVDCDSQLTMRRQRAEDLDGDSCAELCVETVKEVGEGLFSVMDLDDRKGAWFPVARRRRIEAWRYDAPRAQLIRAPSFDAACPTDGYAFFVPRTGYDDALAGRAYVQGDRAVAPCPKVGRESCFDRELCQSAVAGPPRRSR